ncbi:MAG: hypothetical protein WCF06_07120 [Nitrososphaeraceae archaeon]
MRQDIVGPKKNTLLSVLGCMFQSGTGYYSKTDESWVSVCLYDNEHHYRGPAVFGKIANAKNYDDRKAR